MFFEHYSKGLSGLKKSSLYYKHGFVVLKVPLLKLSSFVNELLRIFQKNSHGLKVPLSLQKLSVLHVISFFTGIDPRELCFPAPFSRHPNSPLTGFYKMNNRCLCHSADKTALRILTAPTMSVVDGLGGGG
jgi:hypothetical protein